MSFEWRGSCLYCWLHWPSRRYLWYIIQSQPLLSCSWILLLAMSSGIPPIIHGQDRSKWISKDELLAWRNVQKNCGNHGCSQLTFKISFSFSKVSKKRYFLCYRVVRITWIYYLYVFFLYKLKKKSKFKMITYHLQCWRVRQWRKYLESFNFCGSHDTFWPS